MSCSEIPLAFATTKYTSSNFDDPPKRQWLHDQWLHGRTDGQRTVPDSTCDFANTNINLEDLFPELKRCNIFILAGILADVTSAPRSMIKPLKHITPCHGLV